MPLPDQNPAQNTKPERLGCNDLVRLAELYGINPYVQFSDVWPFGDPHDVGKIHPDLAKKIKAHEAKIAAVKANDEVSHK